MNIPGPIIIGFGEIEAAAIRLADRLDEIVQHPSFLGQAQMAAIHGFTYDGPTFEHELAVLRTALKNLQDARRRVVQVGG